MVNALKEESGVYFRETFILSQSEWNVSYIFKSRSYITNHNILGKYFAHCSPSFEVCMWATPCQTLKPWHVMFEIVLRYCLYYWHRKVIQKKYFTWLGQVDTKGYGALWTFSLGSRFLPQKLTDLAENLYTCSPGDSLGDLWRNFENSKKCARKFKFVKTHFWKFQNIKILL